MLIGYSVANYRSFDRAQPISLLASAEVRHRAQVQRAGGRRILRGALVFGANAGGKSNLIRSIDFSRRVILEGMDQVDLSNGPFRMSRGNAALPAVFEYRLMIDDIELSYGIAISYSKNEILGEWLLRMGDSGKHLTIFDREVDEQGQSEVRTEITAAGDPQYARLSLYLEDYGSRISDSLRRRTILADLGSHGASECGALRDIQKVLDFFERMVILFPDFRDDPIREIAADDEECAFLERCLSYFDTGIEGLSEEKLERDPGQLIALAKEDPQLQSRKSALLQAVNRHPVTLRVGEQLIRLRKKESGQVVYSRLRLSHGSEGESFAYREESAGTKRLIELIPLLYRPADHGVILIDDLDRSLHTNLTRRFLELFCERAAGTEGQLMATTQDPNLMDLHLLRRDELWLVERERRTTAPAFTP